MKNLKNLLCVIAAGALFASCEKETLISENEPAAFGSSTEQTISKEDLETISSLHFNPSGAEMIDFLLPDGSTKPSFLIEGDILMDPEQLEAMSPAEITNKQFRIYNLVYSPRNVNVIGFTGGGGQGLTSKQRTALQRAINNYNSLSIGLNFTLTFGTNYDPYDIVVYQNPNGRQVV